MCTAAILAGGRGRRMGGRPKALLPIGRGRIIDNQLAVLQAVADHVAIVANDTELYAALGVPVWPDTREGYGPLGGILTALVNSATPTALIIAGDMPFLTVAFLKHLVEAGEGFDIAIPCTSDGYQPLCATYSRGCIAPIRHSLDSGRLKVTDLLAAVSVHELGTDEIAPFDPDGMLFFNINTPGDYAHGLQTARRRHGEG